MNKLLITGCSGFVGSALLKSLASHKVIMLGRKPVENSTADFYPVDFEQDFDCVKVLSGVDVVIHCAARAHIMSDQSVSPINLYRAVNTNATLCLARQAAKARVKRFIYLSSIKVNGEKTQQGEKFTEGVALPPSDPYGLSKYEAELGLLQIAKESDMEVVIIRPPLVYGPGVKANLASVVAMVKKGYWLPIGSIVNNRRSLVALDNLIDFILCCADCNKTPQAANQVFVVSDGEDVSTAELFSRVAKAYGVKCYLPRFPVCLLKLGTKLLGRKAFSDRLMGSLQIDSSKAQSLLNWYPVVTMDEQLRQMAIDEESTSKGDN